jgi:hypothetical protein
MNITFFYLALLEGALTFMLARVFLTRARPNRRVAAAALAGLALPLLATAAALVFFLFKAADREGWSDLALLAMLTLALYTLPVCIGASLLALILSQPKG